MDIDFSILNAIAQGIIVISQQEIVFVNQAFTDHFEWAQQDLLKKSFNILYDPTDLQDRQPSMFDSLSAKNPFQTCELTCRSKTGKKWRCRVTASWIQKHSTHKILLSHELLENTFSNNSPGLQDLIEFLPDPAFAIDTAGKVVFWNRAMESMTGIAAGNMIGRGDHQYAEVFYGCRRPMLIDLVTKPDAEIIKWYRLFSRQRSNLVIETTVDSMQGKRASLWAKACALFNKSGEPIGAIQTIRDISDQRNLERQLTQAQKMEAVGTLAGGIAHDFNNLLMAIQGHIDLILHDLAPDHPYHVRIEHIQEQIDSGAGLVRQLLGFAQKGQYECRSLNINSAIESNLAIFSRTHKQIVIERNLEENIWPIEADQGQMAQTLMNLFINAERAMPKGGTLLLKTENVEFVESGGSNAQFAPGRYVKISVSDTGVGMDKETKERIFEPFFTTRSMGRGVGLGMAAVYGIVKSHRGFIEVVSEPGQGATFEIYLPAADTLPASTDRDRVSKAQAQHTILVVDDEETISDVTQELLESLGYRVLAANSGRRALKIARDPAHKIDLIILDLVMPVMGGEEVFQRIRAVHPEMKVLLSSGFYKSDQIDRMLQTGKAGFIQKPYRIQDLSRMVEKILAQDT